MGGVRRAPLAGEREWVLARIEAEPSLTLEELRAELAKRGVVVGHATVWRFLDREKLSFKKNSARRRARAA
jgi:transposase